LKYSRGHVGTPGNERCDEIAVCFSQKKWVELYEGKLLSYSVPIYDVPDDCELPEMRPKEAKKVAYSYLSVVGGSVCRHKDWASCERRVKGQSGAKFKKAMSAEAEPEILKEWGLSPKVEIKDL
jgi:ribonuclease HI